MYKPEILLPAGDMESLIAAVQNNANAVYLGQKAFSARQSAKNFDKNELIDAVKYCHARGVRVYLALNTLIFDTQINDVITCLENACFAGVDAIIVQDLGVYSLIKRCCPDMPMHASTQMTIHTVLGAKLLQQMGFKRVVLARELSIKQISEITNAIDIETEVFVHGALCMSMSGQCYISSMIGARSGNRGNCAGTCRLPFSSTKNQAYDLSLKDLCLTNEIELLKEARVSSLKVEGRMKRPEYAAIAADTYYKAANSLPYETEKLKSVFSRSGFTNGYLIDKIGKDMFGIRQKDDVISATNKLLKEIENGYKKEIGRIDIDFHLSIKNGQEATLFAEDMDGNETIVYGDIPETAIKKPTDYETAKGSITKLGGTIFKEGKFTATIDDGLIIPIAKLNEMRRAACDIILKKREETKPVPFENVIIELANNKAVDDVKLRASFHSFNQIPFDYIDKLEFVILPIDEVIKNKESLIFYKDKLIIEPDRIMFMTEQTIQKKLAELKQIGFDKLLCNNLAHIKMASELSLKAYGGAYLNITNSLSANEYENLNLDDITLSFESSVTQLSRIKSNAKKGILAYGYLPVMITKNCPIKNQYDCKDCNQSKHLTDRMGKDFKVICNNKKYAEILNCNYLYMADRLNEASFISFATLYFTTEDSKEVKEIIDSSVKKNPPSGEFTRGLYYRNV